MSSSGASRRCEVVGHRGGAGEAPENTWAALAHTQRLGLAWMETDLRCTADGVVVLAHDADLARLAGDERMISELTWAQLSETDAGDGREPVRLDEALEAYPGLGLNVDLKDDTVVEPAAQVVQRARAAQRVRFASFSSERLARVRARLPQARSSLGMREVARLLASAHTGIDVLRRQDVPSGADAVQVPLRYRGVPVVTRRFVAAAHARGLEVHVWTVDEPEQMLALERLNVDAVITDVPSLALEVLGTRGVRDSGH